MKRVFSILGGISVSMPLFALEPRTIDIEGIAVTPSITLEYQMDDNVYATATNEVDAGVLLVSPEVALLHETGNRRFTADLALYSGSYNGSENEAQLREDDFLDWRAGGEATFSFEDNSALAISGSFHSSHEFRGTGFSEGGNLPSEPDQFDDAGAGLMYQKQFNYNVSRLNIDRAEFGLNYFNREYTTRRLVTSTRDREEIGFSAALYFSLFPAVEFFAEYQQVDVDYLFDPIFSVLDNDERFVYLGAKWQLLADTTGMLRIGQGSKAFVSEERTDEKTPVWELEITRELNSRSTVTFSTLRTLEETKGAGSYYRSTRYGIDWRYQWSEQLSASVGLDYTDDSFADSVRDDETIVFSGELGYRLARWLDVFARLSVQDRDSTLSSYQFQKNLLVIGFQASL